ncbi:invasion associated locus B family protein [Pyruvatibacter sp.]|uniref:invasion associated locus B family protein n=1 Tax=Pyruvatibacter sp. TaxID=1981328 RepID=UPI003265D871
MRARTIPLAVALMGGLSAFMCLSASSVSAQTSTQTRYGDWVLACYEPGQDDPQPAGCTLSHTVLADGRLQLLGLTFGYDHNSKSYPAQITAPLSTSLPLGLDIGTDETDSINLRFTRCDAQGCYVEQQLPEDLVAALATGKPAVALADRAGQPLRIEFSNAGLEEGLAALKSNQAPAFAWLWDLLAPLSAEEDETTVIDDPDAEVER